MKRVQPRHFPKRKSVSRRVLARPSSVRSDSADEVSEERRFIHDTLSQPLSFPDAIGKRTYCHHTCRFPRLLGKKTQTHLATQIRRLS